MTTTERVVFRVWRGEIIALFPDQQDSGDIVGSYMHVGQHSDAAYSQIVNESRPATSEEYAALKRELESAPYHYQLDVRQRWTRRGSRKGSGVRRTA